MSSISLKDILMKNFEPLHTDSIVKLCNENDIKYIRHNHKWIIRNFSYSNDWPICKKLTSRKFSAGSGDYWLDLYPTSFKDLSKSILSVYLNFVSKEDNKLDSVMRIMPLSILHAGGKQMCASVYKEFTSGIGSQRAMERIFNFDKAQLASEPLKYFPNDSLTIFCEIFEFKKNQNNAKRILKKGDVGNEIIFHDDCDIIKDISNLYLDELFSDVQIIVNDDKIFHAHKAILWARTTIFEAILDIPMLDKISYRVDIRNMDAETVEEMLRFIYTGRVMKLDKMAVKLLEASDRYEIKVLKEICEKKLIAELTIENSTLLLILADRHGCEILKKRAINFINENAKVVNKTDGYASMIESQPQLLDPIFRASLDSNYNDDECDEPIFVITQSTSELSITRDS